MMVAARACSSTAPMIRFWASQLFLPRLASSAVGQYTPTDTTIGCVLGTRGPDLTRRMLCTGSNAAYARGRSLEAHRTSTARVWQQGAPRRAEPRGEGRGHTRLARRAGRWRQDSTRRHVGVRPPGGRFYHSTRVCNRTGAWWSTGADAVSAVPGSWSRSSRARRGSTRGRCSWRTARPIALFPVTAWIVVGRSADRAGGGSSGLSGCR
jgi:hypothetical protein